MNEFYVGLSVGLIIGFVIASGVYFLSLHLSGKWIEEKQQNKNSRSPIT